MVDLVATLELFSFLVTHVKQLILRTKDDLLKVQVRESCLCFATAPRTEVELFEVDCGLQCSHPCRMFNGTSTPPYSALLLALRLVQWLYAHTTCTLGGSQKSKTVFLGIWVGGVADSQTMSKKNQNIPKIFDPNFTFCVPKSHKNPGVSG